MTDPGTPAMSDTETFVVQVAAPPAPPTLPSSLAGGALTFDGVNDYVNVPDSATLHSDRKLTVTGWFQVNTFDKAWQNIFWKGNSATETNYSHREYGLWVNSWGTLHFASTPVSKIGVSQIVTSTPNYVSPSLLQPQRWYHFATVIDADANFMRMYVDGELLAETTYDASGIRDTTGPLRFGGGEGNYLERFGGRDQYLERRPHPGRDPRRHVASPCRQRAGPDGLLGLRRRRPARPLLDRTGHGNDGVYGR